MARPLLLRASALETTLLLAQGTHAGRAAAFDCEGFLRMHGLLRRAMRDCGFAAYNPSIVDRARTCFDALGGRQGAEAMRAGAAEFERWRSIRARDAMCASLTARFPMVVRP